MKHCFQIIVYRYLKIFEYGTRAVTRAVHWRVRSFNRAASFLLTVENEFTTCLLLDCKMFISMFEFDVYTRYWFLGILVLQACALDGVLELFFLDSN